MNCVRKSETFRFFKNTSLYVFAVLMTISPFFELFMVKVVYPWIQRMLEEQGETDITLPEVKTSFIESFFGITDTLFFQLASIVIVALMVSALYRLGPIKQLVSSGISRTSILAGQLLAIYSCFIFIAVVFGIESGIVALFMGPFGQIEIARLLVCILGLMVAILAYVIVPFSVVHITGSAALGIVFPLVILDTAESTITIVSNLAHIEFVSKYLFSASRMRAVSTSISLEEQLISILVVLVYIIPFIALTIISFKKKDIK